MQKVIDQTIAVVKVPKSDKPKLVKQLDEIDELECALTAAKIALLHTVRDIVRDTHDDTVYLPFQSSWEAKLSRDKEHILITSEIYG